MNPFVVIKVNITFNILHYLVMICKALMI